MFIPRIVNLHNQRWTSQRTENTTLIPEKKIAVKVLIILRTALMLFYWVSVAACMPHNFIRAGLECAEEWQDGDGAIFLQQGPRQATCSPNESLTISGSACSHTPKVNFCLPPSLFRNLERIVRSLFIHAIVFIHKLLCVNEGGIEQIVQTK